MNFKILVEIPKKIVFYVLYLRAFFYIYVHSFHFHVKLTKRT